MPVSEKQKQWRNDWDKENMVVLGCKVRKDVAEAFRAACKDKGTTPNAVFRETVYRFLDEKEKEESSSKREGSCELS